MSSRLELPKLIESIQSEISIHEKKIRDYLTTHKQFDLVMFDLLQMRHYINTLVDIIKNLSSV